MKFDTRLFSEKPVEKIQFSLKSDKNNKSFTRRPIDIFDHISLNSSWNEKFFRKKEICRENQNTHFIFSNSFFFSKTLPIMR